MNENGISLLERFSVQIKLWKVLFLLIYQYIFLRVGYKNVD